MTSTWRINNPGSNPIYEPFRAFGRGISPSYGSLTITIAADHLQVVGWDDPPNSPPWRSFLSTLAEVKWATLSNAFDKMDLDGNHRLSREEYGKPSEKP